MAVGHTFLCSGMKTLLILFLLRFAHNYVWNFEYVCHDNVDDVYGPDCVAKRFTFCFVADGGSRIALKCYALCTQKRKLRRISHMAIVMSSSRIRLFAENATTVYVNRLNKSIRCKSKRNNNNNNSRSKLGSHAFAKILYNLKIYISRSTVITNERERKQYGMVNNYIYSRTGWTLASRNRRNLMFILEYGNSTKVNRSINFIKLKRRWSAKKVLYYNNSSTTYCLLLKAVI